MGLDTVIKVELDNPLSDLEILQLSSKMCATIGQGYFFLDKEGKYNNGIPQHVLTRTEDKDWLQVNTYLRYYGKDYTRGNWIVIRAIGEFLNYHLPSATVWYGDDCSDDLEIFDAEFIKEMNEYFLQNGYFPYRNCDFHTTSQIVCTFCGNRPMNECGGGSGNTFWRCDGCGGKVIELSNMEVIYLKEEQDFFTALKGTKWEY